MDWKAALSKFNLKPDIKTKGGRWLVMLAVGLICLILAWPSGRKQSENGQNGYNLGQTSENGNAGWNSGMGAQSQTGASFLGSGSDGSGSSDTGSSYETQLEIRLKQLLSQVDGVGQVEVMIVLKESEEKVWRTDTTTSISSTQETDQGGGTRKIENSEQSEDTILSGSSGQGTPILEKEIRPQIGGVVVSAQGGGNPKVQAEITEAVEALFDVPSHKIKVLKMVNGS